MGLIMRPFGPIICQILIALDHLRFSAKIVVQHRACCPGPAGVGNRLLIDRVILQMGHALLLLSPRVTQGITSCDSCIEKTIFLKVHNRWIAEAMIMEKKSACCNELYGLDNT
jgi:hypothetical protein